MRVHREALDALRIERGFSKERLAGVSGVTRRTVQNVYRTGSASRGTATLLAIALDTDLATIAYDYVEPVAEAS